MLINDELNKRERASECDDNDNAGMTDNDRASYMLHDHAETFDAVELSFVQQMASRDHAAKPMSAKQSKWFEALWDRYDRAVCHAGEN